MASTNSNTFNSGEDAGAVDAIAALFNPSNTISVTGTTVSGHHHNLVLDALSYLENSPLVPNTPWTSTLSIQPNCIATINSGACAGPSTAPPPDTRPTAAPPQRIAKKRPRASRRAPTTVLTTDTSNFRAMVQEFTGIPAPPFTSRSGASPSSLFSPFTRSRLELLSSASPAFRSNSVDPLPPLLRPFAHKFQHLPSPTNLNTVSTTCFQSSSAANPVFSLDALFQQQQQSIGAVNARTQGIVGCQASVPLSWSVGGDQLRGVVCDQRSVKSCKLNYVGLNSSELSVERGAESVVRSEGLMDSWICSSD